MKRTVALTAAIGLAATIVILPGGAAEADANVGRGLVPQVSAPAPAPAAAPAIAPAPVPAGAPVPAVSTGAVAPIVAAVPVPLPGPVAAVVTPPAPTADEHMADLCAAREVFCQVDSSGHYIGS